MLSVNVPKSYQLLSCLITKITDVTRFAVVSNGGFGHWPERIPPAPGSKKKSSYRKCKVCSTRNLRRETGLRCKGCKGHPSLCALCFETWHERFWNLRMNLLRS
ncbi:hypothetical protein O3G_MSEX001961 [Manduca sexta]|uniref:PiggyBac transposable element-derived protein 4 C-terminal zinc-ribbon domain-containing protein n=1 Tax=Manduca sexta TaxID=7130 RepID=A0A921YM10_MANSE|nr:hypothetical protein O3G_MSEX001961 [Manduca sexta]